eukprot:CAMPEP_0172938024 /NCGR_PEP_ID=MMETSP1075-20121228/222818_1 /TAXON_ID=2916 /ORGANISM="Ceratium fusus, Strain PA161109" /LENGTH=780 /DNA_ID=CAMNT_0013799403 /DNA_START=104 /DNA_END=2444 /DNA_ORIENTATION=+
MTDSFIQRKATPSKIKVEEGEGENESDEAWQEQIAKDGGENSIIKPELAKEEESSMVEKGSYKGYEKSMVEATKAKDETRGGFKSYGPLKVGRALEYFMKWSHGSIANKISKEVVQEEVTDAVLLEETSSQHMAERAASLLAVAEQELCGESSPDKSWSLLEKTKLSGVEHFVLRSQNAEAPKLQYLAVQHKRVLWADPPVECMTQKPDDLSITDDDSGNADPLDPDSDETVKDCKKLFLRTVADICKKQMEVTVLEATRQIIDGFEVNMHVQVKGLGGKLTHHYPSCLFETPPADDASLLQQQSDPADTDPTKEEKAGLRATLQMQTDLCKADEKNGTLTSFVEQFGLGELSLYKGFEHVNDELSQIEVPLTKGVPTMFEQFGLGELSLYKGFEHVNDELSQIEVPLTKGVPHNVDHRRSFPQCFRLQNGKESVRNQGKCGSCWAFAFASAGMNNLCTSRRGYSSRASVNDRYEISVQEIISCNSARKGCKGGNAAVAHDAIEKIKGFSKERAYPYKCGKGDPHQHFERTNRNCARWPWGGTCAARGAVTGWMYSGVSRVSGERSMLALIADGQSLYVRMVVYANFYDHKTGVYKRIQGKRSGGHALVAMGYGYEARTRYWLLQNSWGPPGWGVDGYGKFLRGRNLAGIENEAYWVKAWVAGGKRPQCSDAKTSGLTSRGKPWSCQQAIRYCQHQRWKTTVQANCPVSCGSCYVVGGGKKIKLNNNPNALIAKQVGLRPEELNFHAKKSRVEGTGIYAGIKDGKTRCGQIVPLPVAAVL